MLDGLLAFSDPWTLCEDQLGPPRAATGPLFTTSNGFFGVRGRHREPLGEDGGGVLLSGCFETRPYVYPEKAFAFPDRYQTLVNVTDPTLISIALDGAPLTTDSGTWLDHRRFLDLRTGCVTTTARWRSSAGQPVAIQSGRMASLTDPGLLWSWVEVEPLESPMTVDVTMVMQANTDDRTFPDESDALGRAWGRVLVPAGVLDRADCAGMAHRIAISGRAVACVAGVDAPSPAVEREVGDDRISQCYRAPARPGDPLTVVQRSAFAAGAAGDAEALLEQAATTVVRAAGAGLERSISRQRAVLDEFWEAASVDIEGEPGVEGAVRFSAFQVYQATACNRGWAGPAKGLTGQGYEGHHLWDQELYVDQFLTSVAPGPARALLSFRHETLGAARTRARELSLAGAQFPWRTIDGTEASAFFPAGAAQHHVNAAIAWAVNHYVACTGDEEFLAERGVDILVETARMWASRGHFAADGSFRIETVTGPDEYTGLVDNNLYTNVMAATNLELAADHLDWLAKTDREAYERIVETAGLDAGEVASWRAAAAAMFLPYDAELGVHGQDDSFLHKARWDLGATSEERFPLQYHHHLLTLYRHQVVKQADVVLALFLEPDRFSPEERRRNFDYYEPLTSHDSSLSAPVHAVVAADVGHVELAWRLTCDTALTDLDRRHGNPGDGVHIAAAAGTWLAVAKGLGGFAVRDGVPTFRPQLPAAVTRLGFRVRFRGSLIEVDIRPDNATYRLVHGTPLTVLHDGEEVVLSEGRSANRSRSSPVEPEQEPGR